MPLKLNGATSGYAQIQSAAVAANNTLTLPGGSGTLVDTDSTQTITGPKTFTSPVLNSATLASPNITTGLTLTGAAGTSGQVLTSAGSGAAPTWSSISVPGSGGATASGSVVLTSASAGAQSVTPTDYNQSVTLPSATTMTKGASVFTIQNAGQYPIKIIDNAGNKLGFLYPYLTTNVGLADNSTAAGIWVLDAAVTDVGVTSLKTITGFAAYTTPILPVALSSTKTIIVIPSSSTGIGVVAYDSSTNTYGSIVTVNTTDSQYKIISVNATTALLATCVQGGVGTGVNFYVLSLSGTTITVGTVSTQTTVGSTSLGGWTTYGSVWAFTYWQNNNWNVIGINYSGTTITRGTPATLTSASAYVSPVSNLVGTSCNALVNVYQTVYICPYTVNTSTLAITAGTVVNCGNQNSGGTFSTNNFRILNVTGDTWVVVFDSDTPSTSYYATAFTLGSNAITKGSTVAIGLNQGSDDVVSSCDLAKVSSTKFCFSYRAASNQTNINIFTLSGTTITAGTAIRPYSTAAAVGATSGLISVSGNNVTFSLYLSNQSAIKIVVDCSGSSPVASSVSYSATQTFIVAPFTTSFDGSTWGTGVFNNTRKTISQANYTTPGYQNLNTPIWTYPASSAYRSATYLSLVTLNSTEMWGFEPEATSSLLTLTRIESST